MTMSASCMRLWTLHDLGEDSAHVLGVDEEDGGAVGADARFTEDARALGFELGLGGVDVGDLEADVVLAALRVLVEKPRDRGAVAQGLDQLDLAVGRVDEADADALRGKVKGGAVPLGAEHLAVELEAVLDRGRRDADVVQSSQFHFAHRHPERVSGPIVEAPVALRRKWMLKQVQHDGGGLCSTVTSVVTLLAMKQSWCARW